MAWRLRGCPATLACVAVTIGPPDDVEVQWEAPLTCPDRDAVVRAVNERVGDHATHAGLRARVVVESVEDGFNVAVELQDDAGLVGHRMLHAESCAEAVTAAAVVVGIAANPAESETHGPDPNPPHAEPQPVVVPAAAAQRPPESEGGPATVVAKPSRASSNPEPKRSSQRQLKLTTGVTAGGEFGGLGPVAATIGAGAGLMGARWHVAAGIRHRTRNDIDAPQLDGAGGRFWVTTARGVAGPRWAWGRFELPLHGGAELGLIRARGIGAVRGASVRRLWAAAVAGARAVWAPRAAFGLEVGAEAVVPVLRTPFTLEGEFDVLTVRPVALRAWLGASVRFSL